MSWHFSRELVEEYLAASSLDGKPSAQWRSTPIAQAYLCNDRMTAFSRLARFGMTFEPLTENLGEELLKWYLEGFPVRISAQQEKAQESRERVLDSGWKWRGSLAKYDPDSRSWKTRQCSLLGGLEEFSETWPRWGMTRDGELLELPMSGRPIFEREPGLWQTLTADDSVARKKGKWNSRGEPKLSAQVRQYAPTLTVCGNYNRKGASKTSGDGLATVIGGNLNPQWAEWFMGFPMQWTELKPLEMDKYHNVQQRLGVV